MKKISFLCLSVFLSACNWLKTPVKVQETDIIPTYETTPVVADLSSKILREASGVCDSRSMPGHVWIHEDSGNPNHIYLFSHSGQYKGSVAMPFPNRDWEDISIGPGPVDNKNYIYLADIGDNSAVFDNLYYIYRFEEPQSLDQPVVAHDRIRFRYPDGSRDAECIMVDPLTKGIYIVTKREINVHLYVLPYPQSVSEIQTARFIQTIPYQIVTSGGISPDGNEIAIRNYFRIFYWYRREGETIPQALARTRDGFLPSKNELQGEGFCFDRNGMGYFTNSEVPDGEPLESYLYYFRKKTK